MRFTLLICALSALAACGDQATSSPEATGNPSREDYQARVTEMSRGQRNAVFIRAIRDAGLPCQHVAASAYIAKYRGFDMWTAQCPGSGDWALLIGPKGTAQVISCADVCGAGLPTCAPAAQQRSAPD
jgi:hypothetical protein